jgi:hypothetical protein
VLVWRKRLSRVLNERDTTAGLRRLGRGLRTQSSKLGPTAASSPTQISDPDVIFPGQVLNLPIGT